MAKKNMELRSLIYGKFKNESAMADALGWQRQRLNKITNGSKIPSVVEVDAMANILDCDIGKIARFFLPKKSPFGQLDTG